MKLILFFALVFLSGFKSSNGQVVCYKGIRKMYDKLVQQDRYMGGVCPPGQMCQSIVYQNGKDTLEMGKCISSSVSNPVCPKGGPLLIFSGQNSKCSTTACNSFLCNSPMLPSGCSAKVLLDDVQVLPKCTLRESYTKGMACLDTYFKGLPYSDTTLCKANINNALSCGFKLLPTCLTGYCPTVLDAIPFNMPSVYKTVIQQAVNFDKIDKLFFSLPSPNVGNEILKAICLQSDSIYLQNVTEALGIPDNALLTFPNPVCDSKVIGEVFTAALEELPKILNAKSNSELCTTLIKLKNMALNAWKTRCSKTAVIELLRPLLGPLHSPLLPEIEKAFKIVEDLLETSDFLGCTVSGSTTPSAITLTPVGGSGSPAPTAATSTPVGGSDSPAPTAATSTPVTGSGSPAPTTTASTPVEGSGSLAL